MYFSFAMYMGDLCILCYIFLSIGWKKMYKKIKLLWIKKKQKRSAYPKQHLSLYLCILWMLYPHSHSFFPQQHFSDIAFVLRSKWEYPPSTNQHTYHHRSLFYITKCLFYFFLILYIKIMSNNRMSHMSGNKRRRKHQQYIIQRASFLHIRKPTGRFLFWIALNRFFFLYLLSYEWSVRNQ